MFLSSQCLQRQPSSAKKKNKRYTHLTDSAAKFYCSENNIMGCQVGQIGLAYSAAIFFPSPGAGARETLVGAGHFVS